MKWQHLPGLALLAWALAAPAHAACPRIVSQSPYITRALEWLGQGACVVGVSDHDSRELPRTGSLRQPDLAAIRALRPELVLLSQGTPANALDELPDTLQVVRLDGMKSLDDMEAMLKQLAELSGAEHATQRLEDFAWLWRAHAAAVDGHGQRVLVLSACSGSPYSFGRQHVVGDAFVKAGFDVVETEARIRHLKAGEALADIDQAIAHFKPERVFSLTPRNPLACDARLGSLPVPVVFLHGDNFFNPGPSLVDGLTELAEKIRP